MSYDNLSSVSQNVLKFYQQLTGEETRVSFHFWSEQSVMFWLWKYNVGWTDVGSGGYILVSCAHSNTSWHCCHLSSCPRLPKDYIAIKKKKNSFTNNIFLAFSLK